MFHFNIYLDILFENTYGKYMHSKSLHTPSRKYLFFISQDYSFPVLRPLQDAIIGRGDEVTWFMYGHEIHKEYILENESTLSSVEEIIEYQPDAVFVPGNVVPSFIPGLKVEVFHGLPSSKAKKNGQLYHYIIRGMFDLYCTQGASSTKIFSQLAKKYGYFNTIETGWGKLDPLFSDSIPKEKNTTKNIFFASTFSPRFSKAKALYPYILKMMKTHDYHWYITLHPKMDKEIVLLYQSIDLKNVTFVDSTEVIPYMKKCDIMLCDTSSIMYEFLTQHKPVVTFQTEKELPYLINVTQIELLEETLINTMKHKDAYQDIIHEGIQEIHPYTDGKSSQRVLNAVEQMLNDTVMPKKKKPLNFIRNLKLRKALNYWKF